VIVTSLAVEVVASAVPEDQVVEPVPITVDGIASIEDQVLKIIAQEVGNGRVDRVVPLVRQFVRDVAAAGNVIGVVSCPPLHCRKRSDAAQIVIPAKAIKSTRAGNDVAAGRGIEMGKRQVDQLNAVAADDGKVTAV